ncbi:MAG: ABC transporter substrate-binding protein [Candidatus Dormibacterales bacterium]
MSSLSQIRVMGVAAAALVILAACQSSSAAAPAGWAVKSSAASGGGLAALVASATQEGQLNVIGLPDGWVNYGAMIQGFEAKYPGITVNSLEPSDSGRDEIAAVKRQSGASTAPDVVDVEMSDVLASSNLFAAYEVATWNDIPNNQKDARGLWVQDYGGYMSIGYDSAQVPGGAITSFQDLRGTGFKAKVALTGDPRTTPEALNSVMMAAVANGGSLDDLSTGIDFFHQLNQAGNLLPLSATNLTVKAGRTPVVFEWDYLSSAHRKDLPTWKIFTPQNALVANYFAQAVSKRAPHPAAARLWEEYLFSDDGQNVWLKGGAHPVRQAAMTIAGTVDRVAATSLPLAFGFPQVISQSQLDVAASYAAANWSKVTS